MPTARANECQKNRQIDQHTCQLQLKSSLLKKLSTPNPIKPGKLAKTTRLGFLKPEFYLCVRVYCAAWYFVCFTATLVLTYISQLSLRRWPEQHQHHHDSNESLSSADESRDQHAYTGTYRCTEYQEILVKVSHP